MAALCKYVLCLLGMVSNSLSNAFFRLLRARRNHFYSFGTSLAMNLNNYSPLGGLAPVSGGGGGLSSCVQLIICTNKSQSILGQGTRKISQFRAYFTVANWTRQAMLQRDME